MNRRASHDSFHAIDSAQVVAAIDAVGSARAHENIFVVVGHADHFVRHHLANGENQVELTARDEAVHLSGPVVVQFSFRLLADKLAGDDANRFDVFAPLVRVKQYLRNVAKHGGDLLCRHCVVRAHRRKHCAQVFAEIVPGIAGQFTGAGRHAGVVRGNRQNLCARAKSFESGE
jgi:hypothetical protein